MSGDEILVLIICSIIAVIAWADWYIVSGFITTLGGSHRERMPIYFAPLICAAALLIVLLAFAAEDVRFSGKYTIFYMVMGAAWVAVVGFVTNRMLGVSLRDDAIERHNPAAVMVAVGAMLGVTLCFAGGNIGNGPGWWVVVYCAILSTGSLLLLWLLVEMLAHVSEAIAIDRDLASGVRLAGFLIAAGLILGRAAAGDWEGAAPATRDFVVVGWPVLVLAVAEVVMARMFHPSPAAPVPSVPVCGLAPAAAYLGLAGLHLWRSGPW